MSNEEFQKLVLKKLDKIEKLEKDITNLKDSMNKRFDKIETKLDGIEEQTRKNSEFIHGVIDLAEKVK